MGKQDEGKLADNARALELMSSFRARLYVDAMELCHDPIMAESLVLHAIDSALRNYSEEEVGGYNLLKTILKNIWLNENRRLVDQATTPVDMDEMEDALVSNATEDEILRNSDSEALRSAINRLAPEYKKTVVMHYLMDMPLKEIAKVLHRPIGTVKWRLSVAKDVLAGMLKKTLGRPSVWLFLVVGLITGCVATYMVMRLPPRKQSDPTGGLVYNTPKVHEITVHRAPNEVEIDGDLGEWTAPVFEATCNPPYGRDYSASIRMMWDEKRLYIGGDVRTPDPLRNMSSAFGTHQFAGGSIICRLAADSSLPYPLPEGSMGRTKERTQGLPRVDDNIASFIIFYSDHDDKPRIQLQWRCSGGKQPSGKRFGDLDCPCVFVRHDDGLGYTFECAIDWKKSQMEPPKPSEMRANTWNIHFSDAQGKFCTGQIVENVFPDATERLGPNRLPWLFQSHLWGKAVFE